ncbi:MAG: hypothetical protein H0T76_20635 [Nannocystis sp.]|nr:hypothetical protein [Nannocystis sp.]MBA3548898.1 hypothetical protein [Nannocystis sp.]
MRGSTLMALSLALPGCSMSNPAFGLAGDSSGVATSASTTALTGDPVTTTTVTTTTTTVDVTSAGTSETSADLGAASTIEPDTTQTSEPVGSSSSASSETGDPVQCPMVNSDLQPYVIKNGVQVELCLDPGYARKGKISIGSSIELVTDVNCGDAVTGDTLILGSGYPLFNDLLVPSCVTAIAEWNNVDKDCKLGRLTVRPDVNPSTFIVAAVFSVPTPEWFPLKPQAVSTLPCGCANEGPCCPDLEAGELALKPTANSGPVEQFSHAIVSADNNQQLDFHNLQSWVGPECAGDPGAGRHIDWIAVAVK